MKDQDSLLAGIIEHPHDDDRRLVYADWLEENGQTDRAELIRVELELAKTLCHQLPAPDEPLPRTPWSHYCSDPLCRHCGLDHRAWQIKAGGHTPQTSKASLQEQRLLDAPLPPLHDGLRWETRRGFLWFISLPLALWIRHGTAFARTQPLERVRPLEHWLAPHQFGGWPRRFRFDTDSIRTMLAHPDTPGDIQIPYASLRSIEKAILAATAYRDFPDSDAAAAAMTGALLAWARSPENDR